MKKSSQKEKSKIEEAMRLLANRLIDIIVEKHSKNVLRIKDNKVKLKYGVER